MIVTYNSYQGTAFFNTSSSFAGKILATENDIVSYFQLKQVNKILVAENNHLLSLVTKLNKEVGEPKDTASPFLKENQYTFITAKVVKNSTDLPENYLTLGEGSLAGIKPDMGVIGAKGLVGRVKTVSPHFSTVISMLYSGMNVASKIKGKNIDATVIWDGHNPSEGKVLHVVRHHTIAKGDTLVTSEYNAVYPAGVMIGTIKDFYLGSGSADYDITLNFSTDFTALSYVYVISNAKKAERDSLETALKNQDR